MDKLFPPCYGYPSDEMLMDFFFSRALLRDAMPDPEEYLRLLTKENDNDYEKVIEKLETKSISCLNVYKRTLADLEKIESEYNRARLIYSRARLNYLENIASVPNPEMSNKTIMNLKDLAEDRMIYGQWKTGIRNRIDSIIAIANCLNVCIILNRQKNEIAETIRLQNVEKEDEEIRNAMIRLFENVK